MDLKLGMPQIADDCYQDVPLLLLGTIRGGSVSTKSIVLVGVLIPHEIVKGEEVGINTVRSTAVYYKRVSSYQSGAFATRVNRGRNS